MLFKGTKNKSYEELNDELEFLGGDYNAYTDYTSTVYTISCLEEEIINAVGILGDMIINPAFDSKELEKERGVILAEMRASKDDIEDLSFKRTNEVAFNVNPLRYDVAGIEKINRLSINIGDIDKSVILHGIEAIQWLKNNIRDN